MIRRQVASPCILGFGPAVEVPQQVVGRLRAPRGPAHRGGIFRSRISPMMVSGPADESSFAFPGSPAENVSSRSRLIDTPTDLPSRIGDSTFGPQSPSRRKSQYEHVTTADGHRSTSVMRCSTRRPVDIIPRFRHLMGLNATANTRTK